MTSPNTYPAYAVTDIEWIDRIPAHWEIKPFFAHARERKKSNAGMIEDNLLSLSYGNIKQKDIETSDGLLPASFETYQIVEEGNIVFRFTDLQNDKRSLRSGLVTERGIITSAYLAVDVRNMDSAYLAHLMRAYDVTKVFYGLGGGLRQALRFDGLKWMPVLLPPPDEQCRIASEIDRETARIDALIEKKTRFIELLKEKRQVLITQAVTKGLDPTVRMKDSGVEWIGEVPAHWDVKSIGYILDAVGDVDHFMPASVDKGVPYLMTGDLQEFASGVNLVACKQVSNSDYAKLSKRIKSSKGDVIMARYATIGTAMYVDIEDDFLVSYSCVTIKTTPSKVSGLYLFQYLKSDAFRQGIENQINTNTQGNVGINELKKVKMALPGLSEQSRILEHLQSKLVTIDSLAEKSQASIELLKERRSALITAAVTGQIDLREDVA